MHSHTLSSLMILCSMMMIHRMSCFPNEAYQPRWELFTPSGRCCWSTKYHRNVLKQTRVWIPCRYSLMNYEDVLQCLQIRKSSPATNSGYQSSVWGVSGFSPLSPFIFSSPLYGLKILKVIEEIKPTDLFWFFFFRNSAKVLNSWFITQREQEKMNQAWLIFKKAYKSSAVAMRRSPRHCHAHDSRPTSESDMRTPEGIFNQSFQLLGNSQPCILLI